MMKVLKPGETGNSGPGLQVVGDQKTDTKFSNNQVYSCIKQIMTGLVILIIIYEHFQQCKTVPKLKCNMQMPTESADTPTTMHTTPSNRSRRRLCPLAIWPSPERRTPSSCVSVQTTRSPHRNPVFFSQGGSSSSAWRGCRRATGRLSLTLALVLGGFSNDVFRIVG